MRNIMFIGQLHSISFASRYNKEMAPKLLYEGQQLGKFLGKNKNLTASDLKDVDDVISDLRQAGAINKFWKQVSTTGNENWSKGYSNKYTAEQSNGLVPKEYRKQRIEQLKEEANKRKPKSNSSSTSLNSLKPSSSKTNSTKTTAQLLKPKLGIKGKLGLGVLGLAATGAIGYGLYRKIRKDKGKKRGRYFK